MTTEQRILVPSVIARQTENCLRSKTAFRNMNSCVAATPSPSSWHIGTSVHSHLAAARAEKLATGNSSSIAKVSFYLVSIFRRQQGNNWMRSERCIPCVQKKKISQGCTWGNFRQPFHKHYNNWINMKIQIKIQIPIRRRRRINPINFLHYKQQMGSLHACSILKYAQPRPIWATTSFGPEETQQVPKSMSVVNSRWPNSPKLKARKSILLGLTNMRNDNQHFLFHSAEN